MKLQKFNSDLQELTIDESSKINGGESIWYWISYGIGTTISCFIIFAKEGGANAGLVVR